MDGKLLGASHAPTSRAAQVVERFGGGINLIQPSKPPTPFATMHEERLLHPELWSRVKKRHAQPGATEKE